jgi:hypothetical protein
MATNIVNNFISPRSPFEMVIKTDNLSAGSTADNQFRIGHYATGTYNYKVDWGDGAVEIIRGNTSPIHTYASIGTYSVKIWGIFAGINFNQNNFTGGDRLKLLSIPSADSRNKITTVTNVWSGGLQSCVNLVDIACIDTSLVTNFRAMFGNCASLLEMPLLDTRNGTNFDGTWRTCTSLLNFPLMDFSNAANVESAWDGCRALTSFPALDLSNCTNIGGTWINCSSLTSFPFIDISKCTSLLSVYGGAWRGCSSLTSFPLLDTGNVTNFSQGWMSCSSLTSFPLIDTSKGTNFHLTWFGCSSLTSFPSGLFDDWIGVPVVNCFFRTWESCTSFTSSAVENILVSIDVSGRNAPAGATGTQADITITYNVATGALSSATNTAITNLKAKGWKPHINNVYV